MTDSTVQQRVNEDKIIAEVAYRQGKQDGLIEGHRAGLDAGYLAGYDDGLRSTTAYRTGAIAGWRDGYIDGQADRAQKTMETAA